MNLSERELACIIETNPGDFAVFRVEDGILKMLYASEALPAYAGLDATEFAARAQRNALSLIAEGDRAHVAGLLAEAAGGRRDLDDCFRILHRSRGFVWLHAKTRVIGEQEGFPLLLTVLLNSSIESAEHAALLDHSNGKVYVVDRESYELLYANAPALEIWGGGDFLGRCCYDYIAHRAAPCPWCALRKMKEGRVHENEAYSPVSDRWFRIDGRETDWYGRRAVALYSIDITEEKMQKQSLEIDKMDLEKIIGNVPIGVSVCQIRNGEFTLVAMNPYVYELLGVSPEEFSPAHAILKDRLHPDDRSSALGFFASLATPEMQREHVFRYLRPGDETYCFLRLVARSVNQGECVMTFVCLTDVTAEKEAEAAIRQSRRMYEAAVETAGLAVWEYDIRGRRILLSDNRSTNDDIEKFGIPRVIENMPEASLQWIDERDAGKVMDMYRTIEAGAPGGECEYWYRQRPGQEPRCEHVVYTTVFDEDGKPLMAYGIGRNITAQKLEEEKYSRLYKQLADANPRSLGTFRQNLTRNWCGDGQSPHSEYLVLQQSGTADGYFDAVAAYIPDPDARGKFTALFRRESLLETFRSGTTQGSLEFPVLLSDGELRWIEGYINMVQNPTTGDVESITYALDVTERRKDDSIIRVITDEGCDYIGLIDSKKKTFEFRNVNRDIAGLPLHRRIDYDVAVGYDLEHFVVPGDRDLFAKNAALPNLLEKLAESGGYTFSYAHDEGGARRRKQLQYSFLDRESGEILAVQTDITAPYEQEQQQLRRMEEALRAAEAANRAKSEFLSRISHDIRTPMNVIASMTRFALEDLDDREKLSDDLLKIRNADTFLTSLINDILDISRIDSGNIELHPEPYPYGEYVATIRSMFEPLCREKGLRFTIEHTAAGGTACVDRTRINQITLNLLSNAVKYTPAGGSVIFRSGSVRRPDGKLDVTLEFEDTGVGMSEDFQKIMFDAFTQEEVPAGRPLYESGTGLGLSIVHRIVDLMGGTTAVRSAPGQGTTIRVFLCLPAAEESAQPVPARAQPAPDALCGRVLLAEDHPINMEIALRMLESFGLEPTPAENGARAVELFEASPPGSYCAVLLDIQMPVMNGYEAARTIRALDRPDAKTIPIVAMTADAYAEDVARSKAAGMDAHIAKPLDPQLLRRTLAALL